MKHAVFFSFWFLGLCRLDAQVPPAAFKPEIAPYVDFLKTQSVQPGDYLLQQYDQYDIVVFCERDHRDLTQYYFLAELINDPRFYTRVSTIYTELGACNYNRELNQVLTDTLSSEKAIEARLISIYRDISYQVIWDKYNLFWFMREVYRFNRQHAGYPISIEMTSHEFDWSSITDSAMYRRKFEEVESMYDTSMASFVTSHFRAKQVEKRNKALIIMNYPHTLVRWTNPKNKTFEKQFASYLNKALPGKACYIMVNPARLNTSPVAGGKWDAAFKACGYPKVGFDFKNTPFARDTFDVWPPKNTGPLLFGDLFDGFIYINPTHDMQYAIGFPGFVDRKFSKVLLERFTFANGNSQGWTSRTLRDYFNDQRTLDVYLQNPDFDKEIDKWLE